MSEELRLCPFCGSEVETVTTLRISVIRCPNPNCFMSRQGFVYPENWNIRPLEDALLTEITRLTAALAAANERDAKTCTWEQGGGDYDSYDFWESGCGITWQFIDDGPEENQMKFCLGCGGKLVITPTAPTQEVRI